MLDEATASVDSYTEMLIQKALVRLLEGRTGLVIAHRLATIRGADRIIVLQSGRVVETGSHAELIAAGGLYARLYALNYASFDDVPVEASAVASGNEKHDPGQRTRSRALRLTPATAAGRSRIGRWTSAEKAPTPTPIHQTSV